MNYLILACSVCFGDPASPLSRGVGFGVLFLVAVVSAVLFAIAWTAVSWARRAQRLESAGQGR